ncbi:hypothetical protein EVJ58_g11095, partial [Rhodofomes roseus]
MSLAGISTEFLKVSSTDPHVALVEILRKPVNAFSEKYDPSALVMSLALTRVPLRQLRDQVLSFQNCISAIERCPYPVIVAAHGIAYGLSIDIMAACDVRYAASNSVFSIKEVDVGLAADIGTLARLPKIAGNHSLMHELAYTARDFSAAEAEKLGFVSRVV